MNGRREGLLRLNLYRLSINHVKSDLYNQPFQLMHMMPTSTTDSALQPSALIGPSALSPTIHSVKQYPSYVRGQRVDLLWRLRIQQLLLLLMQLLSTSNCWVCSRPGRDRNWTVAFYLQSPRAGCTHHRRRSKWRRGEKTKNNFLF